MSLVTVPIDIRSLTKGPSCRLLATICDRAWRQNDKIDMARSDDDSLRFRRVVLPHLGDAYTLARWITGNRADAEDVVQEACLRAFRSIKGFSEGNARTWVLTIVRNTAYTWLRKNRSALVGVEDLEVVESAHANPGDRGDRDAGKQSLSRKPMPRALRRLSPRCRRRSARQSCCVTFTASTIGRLRW